VSTDTQGRPSAIRPAPVHPAAEKYRLARGGLPRIHGTQTAFVVGKKLSAEDDRSRQIRPGEGALHLGPARHPSGRRPRASIRVPPQAWAGQGYGIAPAPLETR
jgi:uncharacterized protein involved in type VI secretion and phage assembly